MASLALACTVRDCGLPLERRAQAFVCPRAHSYDVARAGYVNLLQPQDRRSRVAGDSKAAVDARARLLAAGVGRAIVDGVVQRAATLAMPDPAAVVDLGAGSGETLAALALRRSINGVGIDLSAAAAEHAARRFPAVTWVVANADRHLPLVSGSTSLVLSLHGRRNPAECARVLDPAGFLLVAVPAHDDLVELRELVQGRRIERGRTDVLIAEHQPFFAVHERFTVRGHHRIEREALLDLLRGTYRGTRASVAGRVNALERLDVTLASEVFLFTPR